MASCRSSVSSWSVLCVCVCLVVVDAFNVDTVNVVRYEGRTQGSMFGFSVALHRDRDRSSVLVGAPRAQSLVQRRLQQSGAVYQCEITDSRCNELVFDRSEGNNQNSTRHDIDDKNYQWFGATISASHDGSAVVACAPRYVHIPRINELRFDPVGTCWVARDYFRNVSEYSPCRTNEWGYHRQGSCQAGFGASMSKDGKRLFIGAPGSHYWQGELFSVDATVFMPFLPPEQIHFDPVTGQLYSQSLHQRPDVFSTKEGTPVNDDTYLGYSVAVGDFNGDGTTTVAVGRPRASQLVGQVHIYTWNLTKLVHINGDQLGAYFGYSLCASDMDGDGLDDLVVGTPLYTEPNNEGKYETGRIYVIYQKGEYERNDSRDGINSKSRFGLAICNLGDINKDGFGDIAVGAPYDNPNGRGAVYIYLGSESGISKKASQVIYAHDVHHGLTTFGFSVSGGLDLDRNEYPDLVVGAYESSAAAFFRARPIVKVNALVDFAVASKQITLKERNCTLPDGSETLCTSVKTCIEFHGVGVDPWHDFDIQLVLDAAKPRSPRVLFRDSVAYSSLNYTVRLNRNSQNCSTFDVYIKPNIRDKLTAIDAEMRYSLKAPYGSQVTAASRRRSARLVPVLDEVQPPMQKDTLNIYKNCGSDNICIPDLILHTKPSVQQYLLGSGEDFILNVLIDNKGEDAFEASFSLQLPRGLNYINIQRIDKNRDITVQCSPPTRATNNTLKCDVGNPLPAHRYVNFKVLMQPFYMEGLSSQYVFRMDVNTTNPENNNTLNDNSFIMKIPIGIEADFSVGGASYPSDVHWNSANYSKMEGFEEESEIGPQFVHVHTIHNRGPADIVQAEVFFLVPTTTFADRNILYLLEQPEVSGPITCQKVPEANFLNLKLDQKRPSYAETRTGLDTDRPVDTWQSSSASGSTSSSASGSASEASGASSRGSITGVQVGQDGKRVSEYDAPSEGGRRREGTGEGARISPQQGYHRHSHTHKLVGVDEGEKTLRRDEGLETSRGMDEFQQSGITHTSGHSSFQNRSQSTSHVQTHNAGTDPQVFTSSNFSASWSENEGPTRHYSNYSSTGNAGTYSRESGNRQGSVSGMSGYGEDNGRGRGRGRIEFNMTGTNTQSTHPTHSRGMQSGAAIGSDYDESERGYNTSSSQGGFRHYSTSWSSDGKNWEHGSSNTWSPGDNTLGQDNENQRESNQDGVSGHHSRVRFHWDSRNPDGQFHSSTNEASGHDRHHSSSRGEHSRNREYSQHHDAGQGGYDDSAVSTNIRQYTSTNWNAPRQDSHQYSKGSVNTGDGNRQSSSSGHFYTSSIWSDNDGDQDLGYAALGRPGNTQSGSRNTQFSEGAASRHHSSSSQWQHNIDADLGDYGARFDNDDQWNTHEEQTHFDKNGNVKHYQRYRRQASEETLEDLLHCNATNCTKISCILGPLTKGKEVRVALRMRAWVPTMKLFRDNRVVRTSTLMAMQITSLPYIGTPHQPIIRSHEVFTDVVSTDSPTVPDIVPLWVVVLSAVAGTLILLLLIFLLWKCGFFKRNRPSDSAEKEPLNRNGHYSTGDEAL